MKLWRPFAVLGLLCLTGLVLFDAAALKACSLFVAANFLLLSASCLFRWPGMWLKQRNGSLNPLSYIFLFPLHALNAASFFAATRIQKEALADCIAPNIWLGRRMSSSEAIRQFGEAELAVLDLTCEFSENQHFAGGRYLCLPTVDHTAPTQTQLRAGVDFISANRERQVYVHCALGHGRSATVAAAWLLAGDLELTVDVAIKQIQAVRHGVRLNPEQREALEIVSRELRRVK